MATNANDNWDKIKQGVTDVERLIGQKDFNAAMIKARQTLEFMVKLQAERADLPESSELKSLIDTLYQNKWITKATCEHYHKIRIIGNKAVHEGDSSPYNANQAYHDLSQEVYTFANDYKNARKGTRPAQARQAQTAKRASRTEGRQPQSRSRKRQAAQGISFTIYDLLKLLIPVLCIILLFFVVQLIKPKDEGDAIPTTAAQTSEGSADTSSSAASDETAPSQQTVYRTTAKLNVRPQPNTDTAPITTLDSGTEVNYVRDYDDQWTVILYNGQEAYVSSQYLTKE